MAKVGWKSLVTPLEPIRIATKSESYVKQKQV